MVYGLEGLGFKGAVSYFIQSIQLIQSSSLDRFNNDANCDVFLLFATELDRIHVNGKITAL